MALFSQYCGEHSFSLNWSIASPQLSLFGRTFGEIEKPIQEVIWKCKETCLGENSKDEHNWRWLYQIARLWYTPVIKTVSVGVRTGILPRRRGSLIWKKRVLLMWVLDLWQKQHWRTAGQRALFPSTVLGQWIPNTNSNSRMNPNPPTSHRTEKTIPGECHSLKKKAGALSWWSSG